jgi:hypothetical protein
MLAITMKSSLDRPPGMAEFTESRDAAATQLARIAASKPNNIRFIECLPVPSILGTAAYSRPVTTKSSNTMRTKPNPPLG